MDRMASSTSFILAAVAGAALLALPTSARAEPPPEYQTSATASDYPDADALTLKEVRTYTLHPDGRIDTHLLLVQKILTYHGMDTIGDPHFAFHSTRQTIEVLTSRTYTPEGEIRDTEANGLNEITPFALEKAWDYTDIRQMVVTHVGLDVGATVVTEIAVRDKTPWRSFLEADLALENDDPALLRRIVVQVPAGTTFHHHLTGWDSQVEVTHADGQDVYTWTFSDIPVARLALIEPDAQRFLPRLVFTTAHDWATWTDRLAPRVAAAVEDAGGRVRAKAHALIDDKTDTFARIDAIHTFVVDGILTADWPLEAFDYTIRPAARTLGARHGHALDKAALLVALLREAGLEADVAMLGANPRADAALRAIPCLRRLTTPLVRVRAEGDTVWLDPTSHLSDRSQRDFDGWDALILHDGTHELDVLHLPAGPNRLNVRVDATLTSDLAIEGDGEISLLGYYAPFYRVRGDRAALDTFVTSLLQSVLGRTDEVEVSVVTLDPFDVRLKVHFSAGAPEQTPRLVALRTGIPSGSLLDASPLIYLPSRTRPLLLPATGEETVQITWTLPEGKTPGFVPAPVDVGGQFGHAARVWRPADSTLTMESSTTIHARVISPEDYPTYKRMHDAFAAESSREVLFP